MSEIIDNIIKGMEENLIEFLCLHCKKAFAYDVGAIDFEKYGIRPSFENAVVCKKCGERYESTMENFSEKFELTEVGQSQLTEIHLGESCFYFGFGADEEDELFENDEIELRIPITKAKKVGRNEPCPCGSGKKFKKCCDKP